MVYKTAKARQIVDDIEACFSVSSLGVWFKFRVMIGASTVPLIYKYKGFNEYTEALISESYLWFSTPSEFNDPFECRPWFNFNYEPHQLVEAMARHIRRIKPSVTPNAATAEAVGIFLEGRHRRPEIWEALRTGVIESTTKRIAVLCLSAVEDSILMWSHYAQDHTGICLGFEWSECAPFFGRAQEVIYSDDFPIVDFFNTPADRQVENIFLTKFSGWKYEKEWRIIEHNSGPGSYEYPGGLLKTITFGCKTAQKHKELVRIWAARRKSQVQFRECFLEKRQFKLRIVDV